MAWHCSNSDTASDTMAWAPTQPRSHRLPETVEQSRRRVRQVAARGDYARAIALLNRLIACHPDSAEDYNNRGLMLMQSGKSRKALLDFNQAIALNPELSGAYNNRANWYAAQGNLAKAIADYEYAVDLDPFYVRARINKAVTLRELGNYDEALNGFDEALLFRQLEREIYAERGRAYHLRGDWNSAIADYRRALKSSTAASGNSPMTLKSRRQQIMMWLSQLYTAA